MSDSLFTYVKIDFKLLTAMLGTMPKASVAHEHLIAKAKKEIAKANKLRGKITKALDNYVGSEISEKKELAELQGLIRGYCQIVGKVIEMPKTVEDLLVVADKLEKEFDAMVKARECVAADVFMRAPNGMPMLSTHMVVGNLKENMRIMVNGAANSKMPKELKAKLPIQAKNAIGQVFALDVKPVHKFMYPDQDILCDKYLSDRNITLEELQEEVGSGILVQDRGRILLERPATKDEMGKTVAVIKTSEALPVGTEFSAVFRVRNESTITVEGLREILKLGKSNGLGQWRGSGGMGSYCFKLEVLEGYSETLPAGGWE